MGNEKKKITDQLRKIESVRFFWILILFLWTMWMRIQMIQSRGQI